MAICPFSTELLVLALDQNLSGKSATSSPMSCADRNLDCSSLRSVWPIIDTFVLNLPNSILQHNKVFSASHGEAPHEGDHLSNSPERIRAGLSNNKARSNRGYRLTVLSKASPSGLGITPKGRESRVREESRSAVDLQFPLLFVQVLSGWSVAFRSSRKRSGLCGSRPSLWSWRDDVRYLSQ